MGIQCFVKGIILIFSCFLQVLFVCWFFSFFFFFFLLNDIIPSGKECYGLTEFFLFLYFIYVCIYFFGGGGGNFTNI